MSLASRHPLRKSCSFCRARKIKCSNERICEACRKHNVDCIYFDADPPRAPKARSISQDNHHSNHLHNGHASSRTGTPLQNDFSVSSGSRPRSSTSGSGSNGGSPRGSPPTIMEDSYGRAVLAPGEDVASTLERMFFETAYQQHGVRNSPESASSVQKTLNHLASRSVKYTGILSLLTHDLVGLVVDKFGSLGCHHVEGGAARFFLAGLAKDETQSMFDPLPTSATTTPVNSSSSALLGAPTPSPLAEYGTRQITQMVDVWFSVHPLSFLVSKTLLLRELRDGTQDEILLAVMLADANFSIGDEAAVAKANLLVRWATAQLRQRSLSPSDGFHSHPMHSHGLSQPGISIPGISTAQALMLLGWNALCQSQIRRASCFIGLAGRLATEIKDQLSGGSAGHLPVATSRINGIDIFEVEKELVAYLWWTTYSLTLWTSMQLGQPAAQQLLLATSLPNVFLPVDETTSVLIRLDEVSDNFSTLQRQKAMIREMWPLANISSVVAYIYALHPHEMPLDASSPHTAAVGFWQDGSASSFLALQRMQQQAALMGSGLSPAQPQSQMYDMAAICNQVWRVLMENIHMLSKQVGRGPSRALVLVVYHTMAIHMLFPHSFTGGPFGMDQQQALASRSSSNHNITPDVVERFLASAHELIGLFEQMADDAAATTPELLSMMPPHQEGGSRTSFPDIFCLALDTCARALSCIHGHESAALMGVAADGRLEALALRLHATTQGDLLSASTSLRVVKKHLKAVTRALGGYPPRGSSTHSNATSSSAGHAHGLSSSTCGGETPENSRRSSAHHHSPPPVAIPPAAAGAPADLDHHLPAAASNVVVDAASSFISPIDATASAGVAPVTSATTAAVVPAVSTGATVSSLAASDGTSDASYIPFSPLADHAQHGGLRTTPTTTSRGFFHASSMDPAVQSSQLSMTELMGLESPWLHGHHGGMLMDFDMSGSSHQLPANGSSGSPWEWSAPDMAVAGAAATNMDSVLYYHHFDRSGSNKCA